MSTENRRGHTIYVTQEVWTVLDRRYLESRIQSAGALSKIEFIEQVLLAGMDAVTPGSTVQLAARSQSEAPTPRSRAAKPAAPRAIEVGAGESEAETAAPVAEVKTEEPVPSREMPPASNRRANALDRLKQASEPGRPAPIRSAADSTVGEERSE